MPLLAQGSLESCDPNPASIPINDEGRFPVWASSWERENFLRITTWERVPSAMSESWFSDFEFGSQIRHCLSSSRTEIVKNAAQLLRFKQWAHPDSGQPATELL